MRTTGLLCGVIAAATLAGCAGMQREINSLTSSRCDNKKVCTIPVTVVNCVVTIPPDRNWVYIDNKPVAILWHLTQASIAQKYAFDPSRGVELKVTDSSGQFTVQEPLFNNLAYLWVDKNTNWKDYDYTINIVDNNHGGAACTPLDPRVINN